MVHKYHDDKAKASGAAGAPLLGNITNDEAEAEIAVETSAMLDASSHNGIAGEGRRSARTDQFAKRILDGYLQGQLANVAKFGIWWTLLSPTVLALFSGNAAALGITRICKFCASAPLSSAYWSVFVRFQLCNVFVFSSRWFPH
jgi:hypothetical protein